jgi:hypothetical protein
VEEADDETDLGEALFMLGKSLYSLVLLKKFIAIRLYDITILDKFIHTFMIVKYHAAKLQTMPYHFVS